MEVGIGHHGEPGIQVCPLESANEMAKRMVDVVVPDYPFVEGDEVVVLVSGLGATPVMELYVLYDEIDRLLTEKGIKTHKAYVGNDSTSLETMGATLTGYMKLDDAIKRAHRYAGILYGTENRIRRLCKMGAFRKTQQENRC